MWPFTPAWNSKNLSEAVKAVKGIRSQIILAHIARTASSERVRLEAMGRLDSLALLAAIEEEQLAGEQLSPAGEYEQPSKYA